MKPMHNFEILALGFPVLDDNCSPTRSHDGAVMRVVRFCFLVYTNCRNSALSSLIFTFLVIESDVATARGVSSWGNKVN